MKTKDYTYTFDCKKSSEHMFATLLDVKQWWSGLFNETIKGKSSQIGDVFSFEAGGGMHYSKQELLEMVPNTSIVWLVTESKLSFLKEKDEWTGTHLRFDIESKGNKACTVTFTHVGLKNDIECYQSCSSAWSQYLEKLHQTSNA